MNVFPGDHLVDEAHRHGLLRAVQRQKHGTMPTQQNATTSTIVMKRPWKIFWLIRNWCRSSHFFEASWRLREADAPTP